MKISIVTMVVSIFLSVVLLFSNTGVNGLPVDRYWTVLQPDENGRLKSNATGFSVLNLGRALSNLCITSTLIT